MWARELYFSKCKEGSRKPGLFSHDIWILVVMNLYDRIFWLYVCNLSFFHLSVVEMRQLNMSNKWKLRVSFPKYLVPSKEWYVPALYKACFVRNEPSRVINLDGPFRCEAWPGYYLCLMCHCCCHMVHLTGGHYCWFPPNPSKAFLWKHKLGQSLDG